MTWRGLKEADLETCLAIDPRSTGEFVVGRSAALRGWQSLLQNPAFNSAVVEATTSAGVCRIVGLGASLFLAPEYADRIVREPQPDCNSRVFSWIAADRPVLPAEKSLSSPNEAKPLDLLLLCSSFLHQALNPEQQAELSVLLPHALVHLHSGYHIRRILMETTNGSMRALATSSGIWKALAYFPREDRALLMVTDEEIRSSAGFTILAPLFRYRAPLLGLRDTEKHLLAEAIDGETDAVLATRLHLSISSVKKRWMSLFSRLSESHLGLLGEAVGAAKGDIRGLQKRHHILAYIRSHPEEIRPFKNYPKP